MSDGLWLILAVALVTYATRLTGFWLGRPNLPPALGRFLSYVPVAAFASLVTISLASGKGGLSAHLIGASATVLVMLRWGKLWLGLAVGVVMFWSARVIMV